MGRLSGGGGRKLCEAFERADDMLRQRRGTGVRVSIQRLKSRPDVDYGRVSRGFVYRPDAWLIEEKKN